MDDENISRGLKVANHDVFKELEFNYKQTYHNEIIENELEEIDFCDEKDLVVKIFHVILS